jgi:hypothetical protein
MQGSARPESAQFEILALGHDPSLSSSASLHTCSATPPQLLPSRSLVVGQVGGPVDIAPVEGAGPPCGHAPSTTLSGERAGGLVANAEVLAFSLPRTFAAARGTSAQRPSAPDCLGSPLESPSSQAGPGGTGASAAGIGLVAAISSSSPKALTSLSGGRTAIKLLTPVHVESLLHASSDCGKEGRLRPLPLLRRSR